MLTKTTKENKSENVSATKIIYGSMSYIDKTHKRSLSFVINGDYYGFEYNDVPYNYIKNLQGDVVAIADGAGNILVQYYYDAWGRILEIDDDSTNSIGTINPIRYRSYYYDTETGFYYLKTRYYSPEICRFLSPDSLIDNRSVNTQNLFSYCANNPVVCYDSIGKYFVRIDNNESLGDILNNTAPNLHDYVVGSNRDGDVNILEATNSKDFPYHKDKRKGSENRQKNNFRERNVAHPNGEEHSRVPKGNRGLRKAVAAGGLIILSAALVVVVVDDLSIVGAVDNVAIAPIAVIWIDCAKQFI